MEHKISDLTGADPYPGEEPQAVADKGMQDAAFRPDYTRAPEREPDSYNWSMSGTHVSVSTDDHPTLFAGMGHADFDKPYAYGTLHLHYRWHAIFQVTYSNMALSLVEKRLKRYAKDAGWEYSGMIGDDGMPLSLRGVKQANDVGTGPNLIGDSEDWHKNDENPNNDVRQVDYYGEQNPTDEHNPDGLYVCSDCGYPGKDYADWHSHTMKEHVRGMRPIPDGPQPVVDLDATIPPHFNDMVMDQTVQRQSRVLDQFLSAPRSPQMPQIQGPMPFIYDIEKDRIYVGHPGERHSDIKGMFTPGGIVEGMYDPKGNVQIRTDTDMPYTVRHLIELWYAMHPELAVRSIFLMVGDKKYKLASANIGHKVRNLVATDPAAWAAYKALEPLGNVYAVGGIIRDVVLGKTPKDVDLLVQGVSADEIQDVLRQLPGRVDLTGENFGVIRYRDPDGNEVEIALPRTERSTGPGHKDFEVTTNPYISVGEDLARRDFTGNAMAVNLTTGDLIDPYDGSLDLKSGVLRSHNDRVFEEDPLRMLRALSAVSKHSLDPDPELLDSMRRNAPLIHDVPAERISDELTKMMKGDDPRKAIELAQDTGLLHQIIPEIAATIGFDQKNKHHSLPLDEHLKEVLEQMAQISDDPDLRMVALLHDIGKPASQWVDDEGNAHYYKKKLPDGSFVGQEHASVGADMADEILDRLRYPKDRINRMTHLIQHHMFAPFSSTGGARRFINNVGNEHVDDLLKFRQADMGGKSIGAEWDGNVPLMQQYADHVREAKEPTALSQLAVNGRDLIGIGVKPGPEMGAILNALLDVVLDDPTQNTRDHLLQMALEASEKPAEGLPAPKTANVLDDIHESLDPAVFARAEDIDPDVRIEIITAVRNKIYGVMKGAGWPDPKEYLRLVLTGSLTTYQWGEHSDFDVSLWVDAKRFPDYVRADLIALMIEKAEGFMVPGTTHPLQAFVVDVNKFTFADLYKPGLRSAYDLDERRWVVLPEKTRSIDVYERWPEYIAYAKMVEDKVRMMLKYNHTALRFYWRNLHMKRFMDQRAGRGDYSESNIVYKWLENRDLFAPIADAIGEHIA